MIEAPCQKGKVRMKKSFLVMFIALVFLILFSMHWIANQSFILSAFANGEGTKSVSEVKESAQPDYETKLKELEKTCALLTKNDSSDRVFEAIVGRYIGSKSYSAASPSHSGSTWVSHKMVLFSDGQEKEVYFGASEQQGFRRIMKHVSGIIGDQYMHWPNSPDTDFEVGICARVKPGGNYSGNPETLVKIGVKND